MGKQKRLCVWIQRSPAGITVGRTLYLMLGPAPLVYRRGGALKLHDIFSLKTLGPLDQFEFHDLSLVEGAVAIPLDGTEVDENVVFTFLPGDEAKPLGVIEPLYRAAYTISHTTFLGLSPLLL